MSKDNVIGAGRSEELRSVIAVIQDILGSMGFPHVQLQTVIFAGNAEQDDALFGSYENFGDFIQRFAIATVCIGYEPHDIEGLSVEAFAQRYVIDSFPLPPEHSLADNQYQLIDVKEMDVKVSTILDMPIVFVLGCPRSGTTLFRAMLNSHQGIWAPGELHLAHFENMADRARDLPPVIKFASNPELAQRLKQTKSDFFSTLASWENDKRPIGDVYQSLYEADIPHLIVDKTNSYGDSLQYLLRIRRLFKNAKFIWVLRSPFDVIKSFVKMQLHRAQSNLFEPELNPYHCAEIMWCVQNENIMRFMEDIPTNKKYQVHYETLVAEPSQILKDVCRLLDIPYDKEMVDPYRTNANRIARGAGDLYVNKHKAVLNRVPIEPFYKLGDRCQAVSELLGY